MLNSQENIAPKKMLKRFLPRTLFARSLLILMAPIILTLAISTYVFFERHWERMAGRLAFVVAGEVSFLSDQVRENDTDKVALNLLSQQTQKYMQINLQYVEGAQMTRMPTPYTGRGKIIYKILDKELKNMLPYPYHVEVDTDEKWVQIQVMLDKGLLIVTCPERRLFSSSGYVFLIWMVGISSVLLTVAVLFMRNQIRPIKRLAVAAERFGKGRDVPFFKPEGAREVRAAAQSFIEMRNRINKQIQTRTAMLAGVSHDLRTPLTRMKLQAEMLEEGADKDAFKSDADDMERMINAYLQFAKGDGDEQPQRCDLSEIIKRQVSVFSRDGFVVDVNFEDDKAFDLFLRPVAFERCISNIISNAQKYAGSVSINLKRDDDHVTLTFNDDGPGISPERYEDVFKPFYREEKSRNSKTGGVGLGLPIAQDIVFAHGGDITLGESPKGGLQVVVKLPV